MNAGTEEPFPSDRRRPPPRISGLALALGALVAAGKPAPAQGPVMDAGTLVVTSAGQVVGRETFTIRRGRAGAPDGLTLTSTATYPPSSPMVTLSPVVELDADSLPVQVQFDTHGETPTRVYARFGPRRVTLRTVRPSGESARELPATGGEFVADDSVFALYAVLPARGAQYAVFPREGSRLPLEVQDLGTERTTVQGVARELRHRVLRLGPDQQHLWYDPEGRLMKVEVPAVGMVAEREVP